MSELLNFPFKDQLNSPTFDGKPDENKDMNCVPSCIAACLQYFAGKEYEPDELKDVVYGDGYIGGTEAVAYVEYCASQGVHCYPINGNPPYLVSQIHEQLAQGHPIIGTIQSSYLPPSDPLNPGPSHCVAFYEDQPGGVLIAMNPWHAFSHVGSDDYWIARLCFNQIWVYEKKASINVNIPQGWNDDGSVLTAPNGHKVTLGFRQYVLANSWHPDNIPLEEAYGANPVEEGYNQAVNDGTRQMFLYGELAWTSARGVYEVGIGNELLFVRRDRDNMKAQLQVLQKQK